MRMHFISCHSILEYDLLTTFTEIGVDVFSNGAYLNPEGNYSLPRPGIPKMKSYPDLAKLATENPKTHLPPELIEPFDVIFFMHSYEALIENWDRIKHKKVIFYSIGQSTKHVENAIRRMRYEGLKIVRMSPMEQNIGEYLGADAIIRFPKDPEDWKDWNGDTKRIINFTQSLLGRRVFCHYDSIMKVLDGFPGLIYGSGNEDLFGLNGGYLTYELQKGAFRDNRVFLYGGTFPSPYTLSFQEAWMTGMPVVALGKSLAEDLNEIPGPDRINYYEIPNLISNGVNGFFSDDIGQLRAWCNELLNDHELAKRIGTAGREEAIKTFGKDAIKKEWKAFLEL